MWYVYRGMDVAREYLLFAGSMHHDPEDDIFTLYSENISSLEI